MPMQHADASSWHMFHLNDESVIVSKPHSLGLRNKSISLRPDKSKSTCLKNCEAKGTPTAYPNTKAVQCDRAHVELLKGEHCDFLECGLWPSNRDWGVFRRQQCRGHWRFAVIASNRRCGRAVLTYSSTSCKARSLINEKD